MGKKLNHIHFYGSMHFVTNNDLDYFRCHYVDTTQSFENWFPL